MPDRSDDEFTIRETFVSFDFAVALATAGGSIYVALQHPERINAALGVFAGFISVVVGTAIAGVAVQSALMSDEFLVLVRKIPREPTYYLRHWIFTIRLGVGAAFATLLLAGLHNTVPTALRVTVAAFAGGLTAWTLGSLLSAVSTLRSFVLLRADAAEVGAATGRSAVDLDERRTARPGN